MRVRKQFLSSSASRRKTNQDEAYCFCVHQDLAEKTSDDITPCEALLINFFYSHKILSETHHKNEGLKTNSRLANHFSQFTSGESDPGVIARQQIT